VAFIPTLTRADAFSDAASAVGTAAGTSADTGGFILGALLIFGAAISCVVLIGEKGLILGAMVGMVIAFFVGWFPLWAAFVLMFVLGAFFVFGRTSGTTAGA